MAAGGGPTGRPRRPGGADAPGAGPAHTGPLPPAVGDAVAGSGGGPQRPGDTPAAPVTARLGHDRPESLRMTGDTLTKEHWAGFALEHRNQVGRDGEGCLPWLLEDADDADAAVRCPPGR